VFYIHEIAAWPRRDARFLYRDIDVGSRGPSLLQRMNIKTYAAAFRRRVFYIYSASSGVLIRPHLNIFGSICNGRNCCHDLTECFGISVRCGLDDGYSSVDNDFGRIYRVFNCVGDTLCGIHRMFDCICKGVYLCVRDPLELLA
jgi:hypothetical protein